MPLVEQVFLKPGVYQVGGQEFPLPAEELAAYADSTNAWLASGGSSPLLKLHAPPNATDTETAQVVATQGAGWLKRVKKLADGALAAVLDVTDPEAHRGIINGSIRFTSPELRESYTNGVGQTFNKIFRHFALTPKPRNPNQGPFVNVAFSERCVQFSLDDLDGDGDNMNDDKDDKDNKAPVIDSGDLEAKPDTTDGPDPVQVANEVIAKYGVKMPENSDMSKPEGWLHLLIALLNIEPTGGSGPEGADTLGGATGAPDTNAEPAQFDESKMTDVEKSLLAKLRAQQTELAQFHEAAKGERKARAVAAGKLKRSALEADIKASRVPKVAKTLLLQCLGQAQFAESIELPTMTIGAVLKLFEKAVPKSMLFDEDQTVLGSHPDPNFEKKEGAAMTPSEAERVYAETHKGWTAPKRK